MAKSPACSIFSQKTNYIKKLLSLFAFFSGLHWLKCIHCVEKTGRAADALHRLTERFQNIVVIMEISGTRVTLMGLPRTLGERLFNIFID